jgi:hypothetical protein
VIIIHQLHQKTFLNLYQHTQKQEIIFLHFGPRHSNYSQGKNKMRGNSANTKKTTYRTIFGCFNCLKTEISLKVVDGIPSSSTSKRILCYKGKFNCRNN